MFRETELKRVTTLAAPHPVCVRYTERLHTVSSFSETDRLGALGLGMGTGLQGRVGGHLMLETKECQAKSLGSCCCYSFNIRSRGHTGGTNPCFVILLVLSADNFLAIRPARVFQTGRVENKVLQS